MNRCKLAVLIPILGLLCLPALGAEQRARTTDGREVILRDDGTWVYAEQAKGSNLQHAKNAVLQYKGKHETFALYLPPNLWKVKPGANEELEVSFQHKDGDAFAMVIAERIAIPIEALKKVVLDNLKEAAADAAIVKEEKRKVNGTDGLCLTMKATVEGIPFTYYGYYYSGPAGSIQVITVTGQNLFEEFKPDLEKFLNGFVVLKKAPAR